MSSTSAPRSQCSFRILVGALWTMGTECWAIVVKEYHAVLKIAKNYDLHFVCMPTDLKIQSNEGNCQLPKHTQEERENPKRPITVKKNQIRCQKYPLYRRYQAQMVLWVSSTGSGGLLSQIPYTSSPKRPVLPATGEFASNPQAWQVGVQMGLCGTISTQNKAGLAHCRSSRWICSMSEQMIKLRQITKQKNNVLELNDLGTEK